MRLKRLLHKQRWGMFAGWINEDAVAAGEAREEAASEVSAGSAGHEAAQNLISINYCKHLI